MRAAPGIHHLRHVTCRHLGATSVPGLVGHARTSGLLALCCSAAAAAPSPRHALFHTSRPLFAPAELGCSASASAPASDVSSATSSHNDEPRSETLESSPSYEADRGRQWLHNASTIECKPPQVSSTNGKVAAGEPGRAGGQGADSSSESFSVVETKSPFGRKPRLSSSAPTPDNATTTATSTALVKTNTVTLTSPSTGSLNVISTVTALPTRALNLSPDTRPASFAPEAVAVARGLLVSAQSRQASSPATSIRRVWLIEEGKQYCDSVEEAERAFILDRTDSSSQVPAFASAFGDTKQGLMVDPMELVMWVADILRPTDPGIDEYLNLVLFPDLEHHTFTSTDELCWSSTTRPSSEPSPPSTPTRGGRTSQATRSFAQRQVENERRFSNVRAVLDRGAQLLSHQLASSTGSASVIIFDHAGVFNGSPQGHTFFDALESSFKHNLMPSHPALRVVYNVSAPSYWGFEAYEDMLAEDMDEFPTVMWRRSSPDAFSMRLHRDVRTRFNRLVLPVFRAWWQAQYIEMRLRRVGGMSQDTRSAMVDTLRPLLGDEDFGVEQLDVLALAMIGLDAEARLSSTMPSKDAIEECARRLLGRSATREVREQSLQDALDAEREAAKRDKESGNHRALRDRPHEYHHPLMQASPGIPIVRPESISVALGDVVGQDMAKKALDSLITLPMKHPEQFASGVLSLTSASGVLLYGPPGTGKTMLAKAVAKSAGATFIAMNPSDVQDKYVGESEKTIKRLFETARSRAPCVIFLDEVDAIFSKRDFDIHGYRRDILNEFCMQWDGIQASKQVIVLGATNRPFDLDEAVLRRFSRRVLVDLPSPAEKRQLLVNLLKEERLESDTLIDDYLVPNLVYHSASDIKNVAISAAMAAVRESPAGPRVLSQRHFEVALKEVRPSVTNSMDAVVKLREFAATMEGGGNGVQRLGFSVGQIAQGWAGGEAHTREVQVPREG